MCRFVGGAEFWTSVEREVPLFANIEKMRDVMSAGGPDNAGLFVDAQNGVALGHRRLSIIDLSDFSNQPFSGSEIGNKSANIADGRFVLVYNGEIYNYKELGEELKSLGVQISGKSDTEVLFYALMKWGTNALNKLDGSFSFALWDKSARIFLLARDKIGTKPLYYYIDGSRFLFASELKAILNYPNLPRKLNANAVSNFLALGYVPAPQCIMSGAHKLEAGHFLRFYLKDVKSDDVIPPLEIKQYWSAKEYWQKAQNAKPVSLESFESNLIKSVKSRMIADVGVGVLLSGGVDSSMVCAALKASGAEFETFSMGFNELEFNESEYAAKVAKELGLKNTQFMCDLASAKEIIGDLAEIYDEPFGDSSAIATILLARNVRQSVKVALSADGGDELGTGYERYFWANERWENYSKYRRSFLAKGILRSLSASSALSWARRFKSISKSPFWDFGADKFLRVKYQILSQNFIEHYGVEITHFREIERKVNKLAPLLDFGEFENFGDNFTKMCAFDLAYYLPDDIFVKTDRAASCAGLEMREPLLGAEFVEMMLQMPSSQKQNGKNGKLVFKQFLEKYLSSELIYRPKMGFGVPIESWFRSDLSYLLDDLQERSEGLLNVDFVKALLRKFKERERVDFSKIWYIFILSQWCKRYGF